MYTLNYIAHFPTYAMINFCFVCIWPGLSRLYVSSLLFKGQDGATGKTAVVQQKQSPLLSESVVRDI